MIAHGHSSTIGLLLSGGLDSAILLGQLIAQGREVQPFYVRSNLAWEAEELRSVRSFVEELAAPAVEELVVFELPLADLYAADHWSRSGSEIPDAASPDEAVYLPGRNPLLLIKPALWCQMHGIEVLALATLGSNPFSDATGEFFTSFQNSLGLAAGRPLQIVRPFERLHKSEVMRLGSHLPLERTFSCIAPIAGLHCGQCNKCAERRTAFAAAGMADATAYATLKYSALEYSLQAEEDRLKPGLQPGTQP